MTERTGKEHTMKRIAIIAGVVAAVAVSPSIAAAGNVAQVSNAQVVNAQIAKSHVVAQRVTAQRAHVKRISLFRANVR
jgi:hypothetical protein